MATYKAVVGAPLSDAQAQRYGDFIRQFSNEMGGVRPEDIVAHRDDPAIADWFKETDEEAAYLYRIEKAGRLLRFINTEIDNKWVRAFEDVTITVKVADDTVEEGFRLASRRVYRPTEEILLVPEQREEVFQDVLNRFRHMRRKYQQWKELKEVFEAIDKL